jgi:hypothetical protein
MFEREGMGMSTKVCKRCAKSFERPIKLSEFQWGNRRFCSKRCSATKLKLDPQQIANAYMEGKSSVEIAKGVGCSGQHVLRILARSGVVIRTPEQYHSSQFLTADTLKKMSKASSGRALPESAKEKLRALHGDKNSQWKGGITTSTQGYSVYTQSKVNGDKAQRSLHRIIAEQKYGRKLTRFDYVHHNDGDKKNNHPDNLVVLSPSEHGKLHAKGRKNGKS